MPLTALLSYSDPPAAGYVRRWRPWVRFQNCSPHGDTCGKAAGIAMEDELSHALTLAFSMLTVFSDSLEGVMDSRCPICSNETMY